MVECLPRPGRCPGSGRLFPPFSGPAVARASAPLTVLGPAVAAPGHRWVRWLQSSCAVGLALALYFCLRMASLGVAIPSFTAGGTVLETFDPLARLAAVPRCLLLLLAPVGPGGPGAWPRAALVTVMLGGLAVLLLGAAVVIAALLFASLLRERTRGEKPED